MRVYDKMVDVRMQDDESFTVSVMIDDSTIVVKTMSDKDLRLLKAEIEQLLKFKEE